MKRAIQISILTLIPVLLTACGTNSEAPPIMWDNLQEKAEEPSVPAPAEPTDIEHATSDTSEAEQEPPANVLDHSPDSIPAESTTAQTPAAGSSSRLYATVYTQAVSQYTDDVCVFSLIYLDNDDIPELVVHDNYYESYSIYTIKNDSLFCMADTMSTVELAYFERSSILSSFARWNGGGEEGGYGQYIYQVSQNNTVTDDTPPVLSFNYNAVYNENGAYTGEGITTYYYMAQETDETTYQKTYANLGLSENSVKISCSEHAYNKEDMLQLLSQ